MSGIEIAGLVLGAFPLLIHALESYHESLDILRDWYKVQRAYRHSIRTLGIQKVQFERNVERFLLPLVVDDVELKELMADPAGDRWENPELEIRLQQRLPESYKLFLDTIVEINRVVESLKQEMGVTNPSFQARVNENSVLVKNATRVELMSRANFEFQSKRIKFSLKRFTRERLFKQLEDACNQMQKLLELDDQIFAARQQRNTSKSATLIDRKINEFWRHAARLHGALMKAWQCGCLSHTVNLGLAGPTAGKVEFDIVFLLQANVQRSTKIKMRVADDVSIAVPPTANTKVRWCAPTLPAPAIQLRDQPMSSIKNLCSTLDTQCVGCIGFIEEDDYRFIFHHDATAPLSLGIPTTSLRDLLQNNNVLTRRNRYCLALTLATSFLRLGATPWLSMRLRKDDIVFLSNQNDPATANLDLPYIAQEMSPNPGAQPTDALSSLGIRLLELCFGNALESMPVRKMLSPGDTITAPVLDWAAAMQWSKMASDEAGPEFAGAIEWCLRANELTDTNWRKEFVQNVVLPLESCHRQLSQRP